MLIQTQVITILWYTGVVQYIDSYLKGRASSIFLLCTFVQTWDKKRTVVALHCYHE